MVGLLAAGFIIAMIINSYGRIRQEKMEEINKKF
jgi:hypothetical protein